MSGGMGVPIPPPGAGGRFGPNDANKSGRRDRRGGGNSRRASRGATGKGGSGGDASASSNGDASAPRDPRARYDPKYDSFTRGLGAPGSSSWNAGSTGFSSQWPNLPPAGARGPATPSVSSQTGPSSSSNFPDILRDTYKPQPPTIRTGKWPYNYVNVATGGLTGTPPAAPSPAPSASSPVQSGPSATFRSALQSGRVPIPSRSPGADALRSIATGGGGGKTGPVASPATSTKAATSPPASNAASSKSSAPSTPTPSNGSAPSNGPPRATNKPPRLNGTKGRAPRAGSRARGPAKRFTIKSADGLGYPLGPVPVIATIGAPLCWIGYNSTPKMAVVDREEFNRKGGASGGGGGGGGGGDGEGAKKLRRAGDAIAAAAGSALGVSPGPAASDAKKDAGAPIFSRAKKELAKAKAKLVEAKAAPLGKAEVEASGSCGGPPVGVMAALLGVGAAATAVGAAVVKSGADAAAKQQAHDAKEAKAAAKAKAQELEEKKKAELQAKLKANLSPHAAAPTPDAPKGANPGTKTMPRTDPEGEAAAKDAADKKAQEDAVAKLEAEKAAKAEAEAKVKAEADAEAERKREEARKRKEQVKHEVEQKEKAIEAEAAEQKRKSEEEKKQKVEAKLNDIAASQTKAEDKKKEDKKAKMKEEKLEQKKAEAKAAKQAETANAGS